MQKLKVYSECLKGSFPHGAIGKAMNLKVHLAQNIVWPETQMVPGITVHVLTYWHFNLKVGGV